MIGNNSCGTHSLLAGKTVDNMDDLTILLYDGTELTVGATTEEELEAIVREGGRRGDVYAALRAIRDRYAHLIRTGFPQIPRRVSGYNLDQLLPENGFHVARALVGIRRHVRVVLEATPRLIGARSIARWLASATPTRSPPPITCRKSSNVRRSVSKASRAA